MERKEGKSEWERWKVLLKTVTFFKEFQEKGIDSLLELGEIKKYSMYDYITREDANASNVYVILKGKVSITKDRKYDKRKHQLATLTNGDCIGEMATLLEGKRTANIIAIIDTYLYSITADNIAKLEQTAQTTIYKKMAISLAHRLKKASEIIATKG
jgi:branched-chain amino acid transport system substrate-binding protein